MNRRVFSVGAYKAVKIGCREGARSVKRPEMMIFDHGHTLCYEPEQTICAAGAAMEHAVVNPRGIAVLEQLYEYSRKVYADPQR